MINSVYSAFYILLNKPLLLRISSDETYQIYAAHILIFFNEKGKAHLNF